MDLLYKATLPQWRPLLYSVNLMEPGVKAFLPVTVSYIKSLIIVIIIIYNKILNFQWFRARLDLLVALWEQ